MDREAELIEAMPAMPLPPSSEAPNDPLYANQPHLELVHMQDVWENYTTGDTSQVIAILDTGVDYLHPDLAANTWVNEAELNGIEGYDDDGNGYRRRPRLGLHQRRQRAPGRQRARNPRGRNRRGSDQQRDWHCGASWNARIMPIKVFQSTGTGNATNVAEGITYAANNGATVINNAWMLRRVEHHVVCLGERIRHFSHCGLGGQRRDQDWTMHWLPSSLPFGILVCNGGRGLSQGRRWIHQLGPRWPGVYALR